MNKNTIVVDLDGTLTIDEKEVGYEHKQDNPQVVCALKQAKASGYNITIATSRNMRTYKGDIEKIKQHTQPVIETWLSQKSIPYDELIVGKPWCGPSGFYVDDKNLHLDEFIFRFNSIFCGRKIELVYLQSTMPQMQDQLKLSRLFDIAQVCTFAQYQPVNTVDFTIFALMPPQVDIYHIFLPFLAKLADIKNLQSLKINFFQMINAVQCEYLAQYFLYMVDKTTCMTKLLPALQYENFMQQLQSLPIEVILPHVLNCHADKGSSL